MAVKQCNIINILPVQVVFYISFFGFKYPYTMIILASINNYFTNQKTKTMSNETIATTQQMPIVGLTIENKLETPITLTGLIFLSHGNIVGKVKEIESKYVFIGVVSEYGEQHGLGTPTVDDRINLTFEFSPLGSPLVLTFQNEHWTNSSSNVWTLTLEPDGETVLCTYNPNDIESIYVQLRKPRARSLVYGDTDPVGIAIVGTVSTINPRT